MSIHKKIFRNILNNRNNLIGSINELPASPKIFIDATFQIGDYFSISPIIEAIKLKWEDANITILCTPVNVDVISTDSRVNYLLLPHKNKWYTYPKKLKPFKGDIDLLIEPASLDRAHRCILGFILKPTLTIGLDQSVKCIQKPLTDIGDKGLFQPMVYSNMMAAYGFDHVSGMFKVYENQDKLISTDKILTEKNIKDYIVFNPFASSKKRCLTVEKSKEIINELKEKNLTCVFIVPDYIKNKKKWTHALGHNCHILTVSSIQDSICLIKRSNGVISVDTALVHISTAYNKPIIGLYSQSELHSKNWKPNSDKKHSALMNDSAQYIVDLTVLK
ncbi:glycosyltransferase family 9 protein [Photobacterium aquimaris]|uniref:Lipopolysaccharide core biosynthesis protein n=1 Tax=Photobacterium aquimaris TaxID=512643 RepID=A0A1Y6KW44_9GAMM|nr:glycosyltransferase family 9 protein [Photobacterium aquimaris]SMY16272.1 lipopolysaccharide core biosynthesis protein [Photobacterium aquimaris]